MTDATPLDMAHQAMENAPDDVAARLKYFERLADSELFLLLSEEAKDDRISPEVFDVADAQFVLAFDNEARLSTFVGKPAPYAALSGRVIAGMLAGQGMGLALNPEVAPSSNLIGPEAMLWLSETVAMAPQETQAQIASIYPPSAPEILVSALAEKLATATGLAHSAYLVGVEYDTGQRSHILAVVDALPDAEGAIAKAVNEALTFSGLEAAALDVTFITAQNPNAAAMARHGLRFDLPQPETREGHKPKAPGSDPENPPNLR